MFKKITLVLVLVIIFGAYSGNAEPEPQNFQPVPQQYQPAPQQIPVPGPINPSPSSIPVPMAIHHSRVCYACSTNSDPSCWNPGKQTTVKYCTRGHDNCIAKTFKSGSVNMMIRDCANTCHDPQVDMPLLPKTKKCSLCYTDLCNGAFSITSSAIMMLLLTLPLVKNVM